MSREQYQVPTAATGQSLGVAAAKTYNYDMLAPTMKYICGDCGVKNSLTRAEPVRCKECGCRMLYKERTKR